MKSATSASFETTVAATISGEDVACGDFVAVLNLTFEVPSYMWDCGVLPAHELVRLRFIPSEAGVPLKVFSVCLPFIYAKTAREELKILDLRKSQIVRLDRASAKQVWKELKADPAKNVA